MRIKIFCALLLGCFLSFASTSGKAAVIIPPSSPASVKIIPPGISSKIATLKLREFQKLTGRKLTIKEKIGFLILKHKIKRAEGSDKGKTALVFGLVGLGLFVLSFFFAYAIIGALAASILAIVSGSVQLKQDPKDKKAYAGKLLGWITLGLIALLLILVIVLLSSWSWG